MKRWFTTPSVPGLEQLEQALAPSFSLGEASVTEAEFVFVDTFDGLLRKAGMTVALADGEQPPAEALEIAGARRLLELARVRGTAITAPVLDDLDKTVVRIAISAPAVGATQLPVRLTLIGLRGYDEELERTARLLGDAFELADCNTTLRDEAVTAAGGRPEGVSSKVSVEIAPKERADAAVARVLGALWEVIDANLGGTIADTDIEFLHDYRVCVRKSRAVLKELRGVFAADDLAFWRAEFKWLQGITGDSRDLDVYVADFEALAGLVPEADAAQLGPLLKVLSHRRLAARREMVRQLRSERALLIARDWPVYLESLPAQPHKRRPDARSKVESVSSARIAKLYKKMLKMGEAIDEDSHPEEYHELRKQGKELRYLLELFGEPLHDPAVVKPMVKALKGLQDVLGRHQDREVQAVTVRSLADEVSALPGGAEALLAMGTLIGALEADTLAARAEFAAAFARFSSTEQRSLVKETFGR